MDNSFDLKFMSDEELQNAMDEFVNSVKDDVAADEEKTTVLNPIKLQQMQQRHRQQLLRHSRARIIMIIPRIRAAIRSLHSQLHRRNMKSAVSSMTTATEADTDIMRLHILMAV